MAPVSGRTRKKTDKCMDSEHGILERRPRDDCKTFRHSNGRRNAMNPLMDGALKAGQQHL